MNIALERRNLSLNADSIGLAAPESGRMAQVRPMPCHAAPVFVMTIIRLTKQLVSTHEHRCPPHLSSFLMRFADRATMQA